MPYNGHACVQVVPRRKRRAKLRPFPAAVDDAESVANDEKLSNTKRRRSSRSSSVSAANDEKLSTKRRRSSGRSSSVIYDIPSGTDADNDDNDPDNYEDGDEDQNVDLGPASGSNDEDGEEDDNVDLVRESGSNDQDGEAQSGAMLAVRFIACTLTRLAVESRKLTEPCVQVPGVIDSDLLEPSDAEFTHYINGAQLAGTGLVLDAYRNPMCPGKQPLLKIVFRLCARDAKARARLHGHHLDLYRMFVIPRRRTKLTEACPEPKEAAAFLYRKLAKVLSNVHIRLVRIIRNFIGLPGKASLQDLEVLQQATGDLAFDGVGNPTERVLRIGDFAISALERRCCPQSALSFNRLFPWYHLAVERSRCELNTHVLCRPEVAKRVAKQLRARVSELTLGHLELVITRAVHYIIVMLGWAMIMGDVPEPSAEKLNNYLIHCLAFGRLNYIVPADQGGPADLGLW